jgi:hypothetical protein
MTCLICTTARVQSQSQMNDASPQARSDPRLFGSGDVHVFGGGPTKAGPRHCCFAASTSAWTCSALKGSCGTTDTSAAGPAISAAPSLAAAGAGLPAVPSGATAGAAFLPLPGGGGW